MKTKWVGRFFAKKNLSIQFHRAFDSESNDGILIVSYGDLKILDLCDTYRLLPTQKIFFGRFFCLNRYSKNRHNSPPNGAREP